ncbi:MAG: HAMP domain-containing sensor histidine kinase [Eubacteriales bacterium]|nr:HAMP domain-containing sensor histidine kinase [Eubacteriales bacterium]
MNRGFFNNTYVAHEIRGSLNVSCSALQLLKTSALSDSQRYLLNMIERAHNSMLRISEGLLDAHKIMIYSEKIDLNDFFVNIAKQADSKARTKGLDFICSFKFDTYKLILTDSLRLEELITNLIDNAIKYTKKGHVLLSVDFLENNQENFLMQISVSDTGIGISQESIDKIFDYGICKGAGNGIGLYACDCIALALNGSLSVESSLGKGSVFRFTLPVGKAYENC